MIKINFSRIWLALFGLSLTVLLSSCTNESQVPGTRFQIDQLKELVKAHNPDTISEILGEPSLILSGEYGPDWGAREGKSYLIHCYDTHHVEYEFGEMNLLTITFTDREYTGLSGNKDESLSCHEWLKDVQGPMY